MMTCIKQLTLLFALAAMLWTTACARAADGGYLFVTFKGEQTPMTEQVYFAISPDGRNWSALNDGNPVLISELGEKGMRDPYIIRAPEGDKFYLIATDLSVHLIRHDWGRAQRNGSQSIMVWESTDLVNWSEPRLVKVAPDDAGCTWAPEMVYDDETGEYMVFWASKTSADNYSKHRIWAARTKDFHTFGEPYVYIEKPTTVIDTTIIKENDTYYRFTKDEKYKAITMEKSPSLNGPWEDMPEFSLSKLHGYEGPQCYMVRPPQGDKPAMWCLILDYYSRGQGYQPYITTDLSSGQFTPAKGFNFPFRFRHGSVLPVTKEELRRLRKGPLTVNGEDVRK